MNGQTAKMSVDEFMANYKAGVLPEEVPPVSGKMSVDEFMAGYKPGVPPTEKPIMPTEKPAEGVGRAQGMYRRGKEAVTEFFHPSFAPEPTVPAGMEGMPEAAIPAGMPENIAVRRDEVNKRLGQIRAELTTDNIEGLQTQLEGITSQAVDGALSPDLYEQYTALRPQHEQAVEAYNAKITEVQGLMGELEDLKQMEYGAAMTRPISTITGEPVPTPEERMPGGVTEPGKFDFMDRAREIKEEGVVPFVPFVSGAKEVKDVAGVAAAAYKLKEGTATPEEKADLLDFIERANRDTTFGYKVLDTVALMPAFMGEFLLTSGLYTAGRKVGTQAAVEILKSYMGKTGKGLLEKDLGKIGIGIAGGVAGGTLQAPIMGAPRIVSGTIERSMPKLKLSRDEEGKINAVIGGEGEDLLIAFTKALGDQWAETVSEHSGGLFRMLNGSAKNAAIRAGLFSATMKVNPGMSPNKVNNLFGKMAYHGVINEMLEERVGEGLRAGLGLQEYKIPTAEQLAVELVAFSVPGVIQALGARAFREEPTELLPPTPTPAPIPDEDIIKDTIREELSGYTDEELEVVYARARERARPAVPPTPEERAYEAYRPEVPIVPLAREEELPPAAAPPAPTPEELAYEAYRPEIPKVKPAVPPKKAPPTEKPKPEVVPPETVMSPELKELHDHKARTLGFEKAGGSFVEGYLKKLAKVAEKTDMTTAMAAYNALSEYKKGNIEQASLEAEKILGKLHKAEKEALMPKPKVAPKKVKPEKITAEMIRAELPEMAKKLPFNRLTGTDIRYISKTLNIGYGEIGKILEAEEKKVVPEKPKREAPRMAAIGTVTLGKVDMIEERGWEIGWADEIGEIKAGSERYYDLVGPLGGGKADRFIEAGLSIRKKKEVMPEVPEVVPAGKRWDALSPDAKIDLVKKAGWVTKGDALTALGRKISESKWVGLSGAAKNILKRHIKPEEPAIVPEVGKKAIGLNTNNEMVYEDEKGRYLISDGIIDRTTRKIGPKGEKFKPYSAEELYKKGNLTYLTAEEIKSFKVAEFPPKKTPDLSLARWVKYELDQKHPINWRDLYKAADMFHGGTQAEGKYTSRQAFDAMELGMNLWIQENIEKGMDPAEAIKLLDKKQGALATQTKRTKEQIEFQQFSTPPTHSRAMAWVANIGPNDVVLEPSAGTGSLVVQALIDKPAEVIANELEARRAKLLENLGIKVYQENAAHLNAVLPAEVKPTVILMNPPFSSDILLKGKRKATGTGAEHIEQALMRLEDGGRLVALAGRGMALAAPKFRKWWGEIRAEYNVKAVIGISGKEYKKYGTTFDNVLIVIDKTGPTKLEPGIVVAGVDKVEEVVPLLEGIHGERTPAGKRKVTKPVVEEGVTGVEVEAKPERPLRPPTYDVGVEGEERPTEPGGLPGPPRRDGILVETRPEGVPVVPSARRPPGAPGIIPSEEPGEREPGVGRPGVPSVTPVPPSAVSGRPGIPDKEITDRISPDVEYEENKPTKKAKELTDSLFENYIPSVKIKGAQKHPAPIAESAAMAAVESPPITRKPKIPQNIIDSGKLSDIQMEFVARAGEVHEEIMPDGQRAGIMCGDGTGVGKGAQQAGIILDSWNHGRKKAVWISEKMPLMKETVRDLDWVGMDGKNITFRPKVGEKIKREEGVLYTTYSTLASEPEEKQTRLDQIVEWLGHDFDGVICFDESHNMARSTEERVARGTKPPSKKALAGVHLQTALPNARVVYASATAATEVENFAYAERLGLWGEGTAFPSKGNFIQSIKSGGIAAMEVVASNLKSMGRLAARTLAYNVPNNPDQTVTYETLTHKIIPADKKMYNELAQAWQIVLENIDEALEETGGSESKEAKRNARGQFWGAQQRFFSQVLTSLPVPTLIKHMEKKLETENSCILQLYNTNEALQDRRRAQAEEADLALEDIDLTPRDILMQYLEKSFPVKMWEEYYDEVSDSTQMRPVRDSAGDIVTDPRAVARRDQLMKDLAGLAVPETVMERIINHFGSKNVAEVTGRKRRLVRQPDGTVIEERMTPSSRAKDIDFFMDKKKRILMFSNAGGTGKGYHSDLDRINQEKRIHYLVQAGWIASRAIQGFGRSHRTNQRFAPHDVLVTTDIASHKRFFSSIARRLDQVGALTKGERKTTGQGIFSAEMNLENEYADMALAVLFDDLQANRVEGLDLFTVARQMGFGDISEMEGDLIRGLDLSMTRFLNRMLSMEIDEQNKLFDAFFVRLEAQIQYAIDQGIYESGIETLRADKIEKISEQDVDVPVGKVKYTELELTYPIRPTTYMDLEGTVAFGERDSLFLKNKRSGKLYFFRRGLDITEAGGAIRRRVIRISPTATIYMNQSDVTEEKYEQIPKGKKAQKIWDAQVKKAPKTRTHTEHLMSGTLLPIWDRLPEEIPKIARVRTDEGEVILGRRIAPSDLAKTQRALSIGIEKAPEITSERAIEALMEDDATLVLANNWTIKTRVVSGEDRIEIAGPRGDAVKMLEDFGAFTEIIGYKLRVFVPLDQANEIIGRIIKSKPVVEIQDRRGRPTLEEPEIPYARESEIAYGSREKASEAIEWAAKRVEAVSGRRMPDRRGVPEFGVAEELRAKRWVSFTGRKLTQGKESQEIAELFQVYRSPKIEILHSIYTAEDGTILGHNAMTSGEINAVGPTDISRYIYKMKSAATRLGAAKVHILHNHPSGNTEMSVHDVMFAQRAREDLGNSMGEFIVINHGVYSRISAYEKDYSTLEYGTFKIIPGIGDWIEKKGPRLTGPDVTASFGKYLAYDKTKACFIYVDQGNNIQTWSVHDKKILKRRHLQKIIEQQIKTNNSTKVIIITDDIKDLRRLILRAKPSMIPYLLDVQDTKGYSMRESFPTAFSLGTLQRTKPARGLFEPESPYDIQTTDEISTGMSLFDDLEADRTYAQEINTERDESVYHVNRRAAELEKQVKELTGTGRRKGVVGRLLSAEKMKYWEFETRKLSRAMLYYREAKINPEKAEKFEEWAIEELKTARGDRRIRIKAQLESYRGSQNLTDEQKRFVDETMDKAFSEVADEAIGAGIITRTKENYVRRIWDLPRNRSGLSKYGFKTFTTAQLQRKFETIYDGFVRDMDLRVSGITSSYGEIAEEIAVVKANKNFIKASLDAGILTTDSRKRGYIPLNASGFSAWARKAGAKIKTRPSEPGLLQIDTHGRKIFFAPPTLQYGAIRPGATRVSRYFVTREDAEEWIRERRETYRIDRVQQADVFEKVTLYAPERIGEMLNKMTETGGRMFQTPVMGGLLRFNAGTKGWILLSSFFHHMAGERSWMFGVNHEILDYVKKGDFVQAIKNVGTAVNSVSAHKRGLDKIESNSAQLALLVRQGLTLGKMQDWDEALLREQRGLTETLMRGLGAEKVAGVMEKGRIKREMFTNSLFRRFFAGLKAEAAVTELNYRVKRAAMKGKTPNVNRIAEDVAWIINADFGGLHLTRMGRSKDMQKMLRLVLLAPDWTESNFRTFTGMIPGANKTIDRLIGDMPPPPGLEKVCRGFWGGVIIKATLTTMVAQAIADLWNDDDEGWREDEFFNNFRRMKWTGVNITGLYRSLGVDVPENERRIFSVVGHFADPLKIMHPPKLIKGKGSPLTRIAEAAMSKSDWRERPYTSFGEWAATGKLKKKSRYQPKENFWDALPSIAADQILSMQPIQFGHLLRYWIGEEDGLSALLASGGAHITTAYKPRKPKPGKIHRLKGGLAGGGLKGGLK